MDYQFLVEKVMNSCEECELCQAVESGEILFCYEDDCMLVALPTHFIVQHIHFNDGAFKVREDRLADEVEPSTHYRELDSVYAVTDYIHDTIHDLL